MSRIDFEARRQAMVAQQIEARGITDPRVLAAMRAVPREDFVSPGWREQAYHDGPLPIEAEQTISQPYIVALMCEALLLKGDERVLEVGTGSGYAAAVLSRLAAEVYSVECIAELADLATKRLAAHRCTNVAVHAGDGSLGWPDAAPYDAIVVTAAGPDVPAALKAQLKIGGRLVMPVGERHGLQELLRLTRTGEHDERRERLLPVRFVPLTGQQGWPA